MLNFSKNKDEFMWNISGNKNYRDTIKNLSANCELDSQAIATAIEQIKGVAMD
jgi:hypothetical protein